MSWLASNVIIIANEAALPRDFAPLRTMRVMPFACVQSFVVQPMPLSGAITGCGLKEKCERCNQAEAGKRWKL